MMYRLEGAVDGQHLVFPLHDGANTIGRSTQRAEIVLQFPGVSRVHAEIVVSGEEAEIHDLGARNGIAVNGNRVTNKRLRSGDQIALGEVALHFLSGNCSPAPPAGDDGLGSSQSYPLATGREPRLLDQLIHFGDFLVSDDDPEEAGPLCLERVARLFSFRKACLFLLNDVGELELRCCTSRRAGSAEPPVSRSVIESVLRQRQPLLVTDVDGGEAMLHSARSKGIRSLVAVPLLHGTDILGVLYMDEDDPVRRFWPRHLQRLQLLASLVAAKLAKSKVSIELQTAADIARRFLSEPQSPEGFDVAVSLEPCAKVGGDLYETLLLPDGRYMCAVGDVAGKGVGAAFVMAETLATLRALAPAAATPRQLALRLHDLLVERLEAHVFITLFLAYLEPWTGRFDFVNAGHEPAVLIAPGLPPQTLASTGPPIGMDIPVPLGADSIVIPPGALFAAWSDGITEALRVGSRPAEMFTRERLVERLEALREASADEVARGVLESVDTFLGGVRPQDDRTLLVLRRHAG